MADAPRSPATGPVGELDVLIVGAGPTGLTLAARLRSFGTRARCNGCSGRHDHSLARRIAAVR
jgi:NADH dehydrogenase FAD-containing subunit